MTNLLVIAFSDEARASCEGRVTVDQLRKAPFSMENNTSPGVDGLTTNFYKHFWPLLCDKLANLSGILTARG